MNVARCTSRVVGVIGLAAVFALGASPIAQRSVPPASRTGGEALQVQGFAELSAARLRELFELPQPDPRGDDDRCDDNTTEECQRGGTATVALEPVADTLMDVFPAALLQTPAPVTSWKGLNNQSWPADPQIAASTTHIVITLVQSIAFYDKAGTLLKELSSRKFFSPLGLDDGTTEGIDRYSDMRVIFDDYRKRFWVGAVSRSSKVTPAQNRSLVTIAVSRTENPLDGWYLYWWDAAVNWGVPNPGWQPGDSADYPMIGIDPFAIHVVHMIGNNVTAELPRYWRLQFLPAAPLAAGQPASGWHYFDLTNPDGSKVGLIQPVVHHGASGRAYYASRPCRGDDKPCDIGGKKRDKLVVWALTDPLTPSQKLNRVELTMPTAWNAPLNAPQLGSGKQIRMDNLGTDIVKAVYRFPYLFLSTTDGPAQGITQFTSIRFVRLSVIAFPNIPTDPSTGFVSRTFGGFSSLDDPPGAEMYYGWPAVEVNKNRDAVLVYARSGPTIYPEIRFSAYMANENDIRPSRLLKAGEAAYDYDLDPGVPQVLRWGDLAGASVDPKDHTGIWIAHQYARSSGSSNNYAIWVSKVFGKLYYDWYFSNGLSVTPEQVAAGGSVEAFGEIRNQGDGPAPETQLVISIAAVAGEGDDAERLALLTVPSLRAGEVHPFIIRVSLPEDLPPGDYRLRAKLGQGGRGRADEYSLENNLAVALLRVER